MSDWQVDVGDCRDLMAAMARSGVDAIVTDPPYGIGFMGAAWDHAVPGPEYWTAALRVVRPGAHLVAFGGTKTWHRLWCAIEDAGWEIRDTLMWVYGQGQPKSKGSLKPAWEPIILAAAPGETPVLNVERCRIGTGKGAPTSAGRDRIGQRAKGNERGRSMSEPGRNPNVGRWPANLAFDFEAAESLDAQSGVLRHGAGASGFFFCGKPRERERNLGGVDNTHPTVKPIALMRWLVRLVATPGELVLDPFCGSGTTGIAAELESVRFVGHELKSEHAEIARARIAAADEWRVAA